MPRFAVVTNIGGRRLVARYCDDREYAEKVAKVLTEGSMSNPRAMCQYWVEEEYTKMDAFREDCAGIAGHEEAQRDYETRNDERDQCEDEPIGMDEKDESID